MTLQGTKAKDKFAAASNSKDYHTAQSLNFIRNWSPNWINYPQQVFIQIKFTP